MSRLASFGLPDQDRARRMLAVEEPQPAGTSGEPSHLRCPFCDAADPRLVSLFGSQLLMSQYQCSVCHSYFEAVRAELDDVGGQQQA